MFAARRSAHVKRTQDGFVTRRKSRLSGIVFACARNAQWIVAVRAVVARLFSRHAQGFTGKNAGYPAGLESPAPAHQVVDFQGNFSTKFFLRNSSEVRGRREGMSERYAGNLSGLSRTTAAALLAPVLVASAVTIGVSPVLAQGRASAIRGSANPDVHGVLVIPVNLRGRASVVADRKQIAQALYGATESVASRYRALSYGRVQFAGSQSDVTAPVTLPEPPDICNAGLRELAGEAEAELTREGIAYGAYRHFVFVVPADVPCWWTGVGDIGGTRVWVKATTAKALQHELGHNLGMNHAVRWQGTDADASDFMGSGAAGLNAPHIVEMGWLRNRPGKVIEVTQGADITLETLEAPPSEPAVPKVAIVHPAPGGNTYYLSYRAAGPDDPLPEEFTRGLNIHIFDGAQLGGGLTYFVASLSDGAVYRDGPLVIRQVSHLAGRSVTIHISLAGTDRAMPAGPPPARAGTLQSLASGKCVDLPGGQVSESTQVIQYDCHGGPNQQWKFVSAGAASIRPGINIVSRLSGKCIGINSAGSQIVQSRCDGSPDQLWAIESAGSGNVIRNSANGQCLDVPGASLANGAKLIAWTCNGGINQTWRYQTKGVP
jgi:Ricin-type beta-trefoil lectin domain/Gametolysin peptidase M11